MDAATHCRRSMRRRKRKSRRKARLIGRRYGVNRVIGHEPDQNGVRCVRIECELCARQRVVTVTNLPASVGCPCTGSDFYSMLRRRFGYLRPIVRLLDRDIWMCACYCGVDGCYPGATLVFATTEELLSGEITSCKSVSRIPQRPSVCYCGGIVNGVTHPSLAAFKSMWNRCTNPRDKSYASYRRQRIGICDEWRTFERFVEDMGMCPAGKTLDRIRTDQWYEARNCLWSTPKQQAQNRDAWAKRQRRIEALMHPG